MKKYALIYQPNTKSYITVDIKFLNEHIHTVRKLKPICIGLLWEIEKASTCTNVLNKRLEPHSPTSLPIQCKVYGEHNLTKR